MIPTRQREKVVSADTGCTAKVASGYFPLRELRISQEGTEELNILLDSDEFLKAMDACTLKIWPHDPVPGESSIR